MSTDHGPLLREVAHLIWPDARAIELTRATRPTPGTHDYIPLPHARAPRWLLPSDAPATADAVTAQTTSVTKRAVVGLLAGAHRSGLTRRLPLRRLRVAGGDDDLPRAVAEALGDEVRVAIRLGSWTHPRSLVVRAFDRDGGTVAFGKLGIDAEGRESVLVERAGLERAAELGLRLVDHPSVRYAGRWRGLELLLVTPLVPTGTDAGGATGTGMPVAAMLELARAGTPRASALTQSRWAASVRRRVADVADPTRRAELAQALAHLAASCGDLVVPLGCWHGDWTPWNMAWDGPRVLLWDWEHFAEDVPGGFDLVHYLAQERRVTRGTGRGDEDTWRTQAADALADHVELDPTQQRAVLAAYLLEVNLRYVLDRQTTPDADSRRDGWGLDLLRRELDDPR